MPYCSECGVEVDQSTRNCPLCNAPIYSSSRPPEGEQGYAESSEIEDLLAQRPPGYARALAIQLLSLVCVTPVLVSLVINWLITGEFTWSLYVGVSMAAVWVYSVVPILLRRHISAILAICIGVTGILMWTVDILDERSRWFWEIGLPILAVLAVITGLVTLAAAISRSRGANVAAYILMGIILLCGAVDFISKRYVGADEPPFTWSLIVAAAIGPVTLFLLYFHYSLAPKINLWKRLHL
ncbi:MAG: DUF6320 domain-containing protein [Spirochaeta sp.]